MKIVFLNDKGGMFHGVTGEKLDVINLDEASSNIVFHSSFLLKHPLGV